MTDRKMDATERLNVACFVGFVIVRRVTRVKDFSVVDEATSPVVSLSRRDSSPRPLPPSRDSSLRSLP
ncbi:hypothetical protein Rcae01_04535 [Novipirellula caenicola]|uniref:Uncharacterized protein n=1 Tax=Novipirellula caenicola TaxID=1536901 RepID=A0ABP9VW59_9BACT